jgi:hypothetical protein
MFLLALPTVEAQTEEEIQMMYVSFLEREGYAPSIDSDGDVQFKREGKSYFLAVDSEDPIFFRLVLANIWPIESEEERVEVLRAMDAANAKTKVAKMHLVKDNVWVSVEIFQKEVGDYEAYFNRCIRTIIGCVDNYLEAMNE